MGATDNNFVCKTEFETSDVVLGLLLTVGIVISFLPQIIVMIYRKNVDGLSVIMCWLNYANLIQLAPPFLCSFVIFILYVIYRPRLTREQINENSKIIQENPPIKYHEQNSSTLSQSEKPINNNGADSIKNSSDENSNISISLNSEDSPVDQNNIASGSGSSSSSGSGSSVQIVEGGGSIVNDSNIENNYEKDQQEKQQMKPKNKVDAFIIKMDWYSQPLFWGSIVLSIIMFSVGVGIVYGVGPESKALQIYAFSCGIFAMVLVFLQWIPQIYTTIIANEIGSLSLVSVCIQAPGAFLVMYFQIDSKQNWSTWVPYLATGIQMIVLIVICVYYLIRDRKKNKKLKKQVEQGQIQDESPQNYQTEKTI
ncbi:hypothetical protein DICPUDRAFT_90885 [Dictyostelium purpureum]|uniref:PQ-loop repeat-containing protein n=1 Tax=Dictyostelium purpureum TaxID=5786 RepID=F1A5G3_DICPU|nr:uncharacterized protein DICPUDRAFT_90885 [Dictyostelium purpureum]EGC28566.1 hypothetical protein DICPUDRAFT_90885 [Dictyostelium purpureum]|eukprot:XP_003294907.1 hypothetical protein DICPUDRAFT_90885 [Dictyostelium purpureum]